MCEEEVEDEALLHCSLIFFLKSYSFCRPMRLKLLLLQKKKEHETILQSFNYWFATLFSLPSRL